MTTAGGLFVTERYEAALADLDVVQGLEPRWTATLTLRAAILAALGERDQARALKARVSEITPDFKPTSIAYVFPFIDDTFIDKLRVALESADWRWQ
jgi:hypothetical protein